MKDTIKKITVSTMLLAFALTTPVSSTFAKDANLLICESTFLKGQVKSSDTHLFAFEAGMIARDANVHQLLLTHFWPLISKEQYVMEARGVFSNTEAAEEGKKLILK